MTTFADTPLFLGNGEIFGWYHPPAAPARAAGVVVCTSHGEEALCAHRTMRELARRLAAAGFPALRFDYHGAGNSFGSDRDPDRVAAWKRSVAAAIDELRRRAGVAQVLLFGFRLGATLAAAVAAERDDVRALALWSPSSNGRGFLRERKALHTMAAAERWDEKEQPAARGPGDEEIVGFFVGEATVRELQQLDAAKLARRPAEDVLIVARDDLPVDEKLVARWQALGARVDTRQAHGFADMMQSPHESKVPDHVLGSIVGWCAGRVPREGAPAPAPAPAPARANGGSLAQTALRFGAGDRLFGVLTEPAGGPARRTAIVLLNIGANHHVGANAVYSRWAPRLAERGFASLRFDLGGLGDSDPAPGGGENDVYPDSAVADVQAALATLRARGLDRFVLAGICSGGYHAFKAAVDDPAVVGLVIVNTQTYDYRGEPIEITERRRLNVAQTAWLRRSALQVDKWKKLLSGRANLRSIAKILSERVARVAAARLQSTLNLLPIALPGNVGIHLSRLCARGTDLLMVYGSQDPGLDYVRMRAGRTLAKLARHPRFRFVEIDGPDHTFTPLWAQAELDKVVLEHVAERFR
jgi:pimeloyl-ACP methyl ester carboxylesterase